MAKYPWLKLQKKTDPELQIEPPIWMGNHSNGEYFHYQTPHEARMRDEVLRRADHQARRYGMDRRQFLASSMGMALTLTVINEIGCGTSGKAPRASGSPPPPSPAIDGGPYVIPPEATCSPSDFLTGDEFIMDVQTHCFDAGTWRTNTVAYPTYLALLGSCTDAANKLDCFDPQHYAELMFVDSDTTMTVITSWPAPQCFPERKLLGKDPQACGLPLSNVAMRNLRDWINAKAMSQRCINQVQVMPNDYLERQIEGMYAAIADKDWRCGSWKAYPAWRSETYSQPSVGYFMTDPIGRAFIEAGLKLGVPNFAIHKGLPIPGFDVEHNQPIDIGPIAHDYPEANFVIYHSGISANTGGNAVNPTQTENVPYDATSPMEKLTGVNQLLRSLIDYGMIRDPDNPDTSKPLPARLNVFAEMGSAWSQVMTNANNAQHYMGKLLKYMGPDNIVWGTDCVLGGSPQAQICAFRAFQMTPEYQQKYGYPAITDDMKRKIFGLNAAKLYKIDVGAHRCKVNAGSFTQLKRQMDEELGPNRWAVKPPLGPRTFEEFIAHAREQRAKGVPG
jgi:predicted TIM-barrel fold metal-dependent hydrolase